MSHGISAIIHIFCVLIIGDVCHTLYTLSILIDSVPTVITHRVWSTVMTHSFSDETHENIATYLSVFFWKDLKLDYKFQRTKEQINLY